MVIVTAGHECRWSLIPFCPHTWWEIYQNIINWRPFYELITWSEMTSNCVECSSKLSILSSSIWLNIYSRFNYLYKDSGWLSHTIAWTHTCTQPDRQTDRHTHTHTHTHVHTPYPHTHTHIHRRFSVWLHCVYLPYSLLDVTIYWTRLWEETGVVYVVGIIHNVLTSQVTSLQQELCMVSNTVKRT